MKNRQLQGFLGQNIHQRPIRLGGGPSPSATCPWTGQTAPLLLLHSPCVWLDGVSRAHAHQRPPRVSLWLAGAGRCLPREEQAREPPRGAMRPPLIGRAGELRIVIHGSAWPPMAVCHVSAPGGFPPEVQYGGVADASNDVSSPYIFVFSISFSYELQTMQIICPLESSRRALRNGVVLECI